MLKLKKGQKGFTLIELMIVVAIIGILAAVAIPRFAALMRTAKEGACKGNLGALRSAVSIYYGTYTYFPTHLKGLLADADPAVKRQAVMKIIPKCACGFPNAAPTGEEVGGFTTQLVGDFAGLPAGGIELGSDSEWGLGNTAATEGDVIVCKMNTDTKGEPITMW